MMRPAFPSVNIEKLAEQLRSLPPAGKATSFRRDHPCIVCKRSIGPMGRLLGLGAPTHNDDDCLVVRPGEISKRMPTPYGPAVDHSLLALFCRPIHLTSGVVLLKQPLSDRALALARAYDRLIRWQEAYDALEWHRDQDGYRSGSVQFIPPKKLDDVLVLRSLADLLPRDPTKGLDVETAALLRRVAREGPKALSAPF